MKTISRLRELSAHDLHLHIDSFLSVVCCYTNRAFLFLSTLTQKKKNLTRPLYDKVQIVFMIFAPYNSPSLQFFFLFLFPLFLSVSLLHVSRQISWVLYQSAITNLYLRELSEFNLDVNCERPSLSSLLLSFLSYLLLAEADG